MKISCAATSCLLGQAVLASPVRRTVGSGNQERAKAVVEAFNFAWNNYYTVAFPNDEIKPVSKGISNPRNGWGASAVDALSTAIVMQQKDIVNDIIKYIPTIDFTKSIDDTSVSLFETTIRYIGGMLSGYDLLKGPLSDLADDPKDVDGLLVQAQCLADQLSFAFDTPSGIPHNDLFFGNMSNDGSTTNGLATVGTLVLEWQHLSDLTGNKTYGELAQKGQSYLFSPVKPASAEPWPGLVGSNINIADGTFTDGDGSWLGGADSYYEYLIKMYVYDSDKYGNFKDEWILAADSTMDHIASHPAPRPDLTYIAAFNDQVLDLISEHLTCFDGGNFILGGEVLNEQKYIDFGLALNEGCYNTYNSTLTKIGPEVFRWDEAGVPAEQKDFYDAHGFYITNSGYDLRPEVVESYYYAYRHTGDSKYQDWAWEAFLAINATARAPYGFSALNDVNAKDGGGQQDLQESFLFAELLKYLFIIQDDERVWDVNVDGVNQFVFNTEAHPFKVNGTPV